MASYFDLKPSRSSALEAPTAQLDVPEDHGMGKMSLLSPQISKILDDMELEDKSSSDEAEASPSESSEPSSPAKAKQESGQGDSTSQNSGIRKAHTSPLPQSSNKSSTAATSRPGASQKHPHLARFHSLRSMLFQSNLEANMNKCKEVEASREPKIQWKAEHDKRQGLNRPKTPESPPKEGFTQRLGNKLRRLTSKEVPTMNQIKEVGDNESTASDDEEDERMAEDSDINHSDIEDIVRWVSRRDPPSDGEMRRRDAPRAEGENDDTDHESLGNSDVEDLVRWISRRDKGPVQPPIVGREHEEVVHSGYSDDSTQSDSGEEALDEQDVDDLVRWVSRRDGPNAGPIREKKNPNSNDSSADELHRWKTREDPPSGESDVPGDENTPVALDGKGIKIPLRPHSSGLKAEVLAPEAAKSDPALTSEDIDELVQWVSKKKSDKQQDSAKADV